jgi:hydrogenase-1 operon protein HyaF
VNTLKDIRIRVEGAGGDGSTIGGGLIAILREINQMLERLAEYDDTGSIDLRSLPLSPADHQQLRNVLGRGEVEITLNADGVSHLYETAYPGVWWIQHRNQDNETVAELLEIAHIPAIAITDTEDIIQGMQRLHDRLSIHIAGRSAP